jgi:hypothetical protein
MVLPFNRRRSILEKLAAGGAEAVFRRLTRAKALAANPGTAGEGTAAAAAVARLQAQLKDLGHTEESAAKEFGAKLNATDSTRTTQQNAQSASETFKAWWKSQTEAERARASARAAERARKDALKAGAITAIPSMVLGGSLLFDGVQTLRRQRAQRKHLVRNLVGSAVALGGLGAGGVYLRNRKAKSY